MLLVALASAARARRRAHEAPGALGRAQWLGLLGVGVIGGSVPFVLFFEGLARAEATQAAFIQKTLVVWVALLAVPLLRERFRRAACARDLPADRRARPGSPATPARSRSARARR